MDQDIKSVLKETFSKEILPIILVSSGIIITYLISESNLDTGTIFDKFFFLPFVLAFIVCKSFYKKYLHKHGSQTFVFIILTIIFVVFLPLGNRIYALKSDQYLDRSINGFEENESGKLRSSGFIFKSFYARVDMPEYLDIKTLVVLPIDKKVFEECKVTQCRASFQLNLGLLGAHYVSNVEIKKISP